MSVDAVKEEASGLAHESAEAASSVAHTAKDEAGAVAEEAKLQLHELYAQTRDELSTEAGKQQQRLASGLHRVGEDLDSMLTQTDQTGVARDLVQQASQRVSRLASWFSDREPQEVLDEVKTFARRKPGVFIGVATIAGVVAGRLTRALAEEAKEHASSGSSAPAGAAGSAGSVGSSRGAGSPQVGSLSQQGGSTSVRSAGHATPGAAPAAVPGATSGAGTVPPVRGDRSTTGLHGEAGIAGSGVDGAQVPAAPGSSGTLGTADAPGVPGTPGATGTGERIPGTTPGSGLGKGVTDERPDTI